MNVSSVWGGISSVFSITPLSSIKAMLRGRMVFFIQKARVSESEKTNNMPLSDPISLRNISPAIRVDSVLATSTSILFPSIVSGTTGRSDFSSGLQAELNKAKIKKKMRPFMFRFIVRKMISLNWPKPYQLSGFEKLILNDFP